MSRAVALLAAAVAVVGPVVGAASPAAADDVVATQGDPVAMTLTSQPFTVRAGGGWTATFSVTGDLGAATPTVITSLPGATTTSTPSGPHVEARVLARRLISDPAALADVLDDRVTNVSSRATVPVTLTTDGDQTSFTLSVATSTTPDDQGALVLQRDGVYPITVQLLLDGTPVATADTFVDRLPATPDPGGGPMSVAVVADVADPGPSPTASQLATARTELQAIAQSATALAGTMTLRVPPVVVEHLASDDPGLLTTLRGALGSTEVLAVPARALDPSSATAAGLQDAFSGSLRAGEDVLGAALPATPPQRSAWIVDGPISASGAAMLRDPLGFDLLVFDHSVYDTLEGGIGGYHDRSLSFDVDVGGRAALPGFIVSASSHWLDRDELDRDGLTPIDGAVRLMSELVVARDALGADQRRSVVLALPPGVAPDPEAAAALSSFVGETPDFALARLSSLPASTDQMVVPGRGPETVHLPAVAGPDLTERAQRVALTRLAATSAASMLAGDDTQLQTWNASLDALLSTGVPDRTADAELDRISAETRAMDSDIEAPRPFTFTLTGRRSTLRVNLRNTGTRDLNVVVRPSSPKLRFPDGDEPAVLKAGATTEVLIPVQAQTNGTSAIGIQILTPFGNQSVQGPVVLTARVNALSGLGQVVTGAAILVLVSWWYGHFRRRRRTRRALLGEVDNPANVAAVSPDAAEAVAPVLVEHDVEPIAPPESAPARAQPEVEGKVSSGIHGGGSAVGDPP
jgi:hypothetical protein